MSQVRRVNIKIKIIVIIVLKLNLKVDPRKDEDHRT
jgi:hypothetical protein